MSANITPGQSPDSHGDVAVQSGKVASPAGADRNRVRSAAVKVLGIQVVTLVILWLLQRSFS